MTNNEKTERKRARLARQTDRIEALMKELGIWGSAPGGAAGAEQALASLRTAPWGGTRAKLVAEYLNLIGFYDKLTDTSRWTANQASRAAGHPRLTGAIPGFGSGGAA